MIRKPRFILIEMFLTAVALLLTPSLAIAQSGLVFSTSTEAVALNFHSTYYAANHTTESLDVFDWGAAKGNSISIESHQLLAGPTAGWNGYYGGVKVQPDISKLMSKSNISPSLFGIYAQAAVGVATMPTGSQISYILGGGAQYRMNENLVWSAANFRYIRTGSSNGWEATSGLLYTINPAASKSLVIKKLVAARAAKLAARQ